MIETLVPLEKKNTPLEAYWQFVYERQMVFERRRKGMAPPWTLDPVLANHRFTNPYRAADRVSQFLINRVLYAATASDDPREVIFRSLLFRIFNLPWTYRWLRAKLGEHPSLASWSVERYNGYLDEAVAKGATIWNNAYMITPPLDSYNNGTKHAGWLRVLDAIVSDEGPAKVHDARSLKEVYDLLLTYPTVGRFFAFQWTIDVNYSSAVSFDENSFVVPGGGAMRGLAKLGFDLENIQVGLSHRKADTQIVALTLSQEVQFRRLGLDFPWLGGKRRLHLIDIQNTLCEFDKHTRESHPEWSLGGRWYNKIKQRWSPEQAGPSFPYKFPPKWGLPDVW